MHASAMTQDLFEEWSLAQAREQQQKFSIYVKQGTHIFVKVIASL